MNDIDSIIAQLERQRAAIDHAIEALRDVTGQAAATPAAGGRQRQIEAMKKYWAAKKAGKGAAKKGAKGAKKGGLTEAGRQKLSEAMRQRWAAKRSGATKKRGPKKASA